MLDREEFGRRCKNRDRWQRALARDKTISPARKFVLLRLSGFLRIETLELSLKWECLIDACGNCSRDLVNQALKSGEAQGWLGIIRNGRGQQNNYELRFPPGVESDLQTRIEYDGQTQIESDGQTLDSKKEESKTHSSSLSTLRVESDGQTRDEIAYASEDGIISITAGQIEKYYQDLSGLSDMNIVGMIRHFDAAMMERRPRLKDYERKVAIHRYMLKQNTVASTRIKLATIKEQGAIERAQAIGKAVKKKKEVEGVDWF
jgi:hypothetical protein